MIMKTHKHLFEEICGFENLLAAARKAWKGKRNKPAAAAFFARHEEEIVTLREELITGSYLPGAYDYFQIHDPKERTVAAAPFRDRVVHHALVRVLEPIFERRFIEDSFACRKGLGTHAAMRRAHAFARRHRFALKCDIRGYFPSMDHEILLRQLRRVVADRRVLDLVEVILVSHCDAVAQVWPPDGDLFSLRLRKRGLPIGNLTSQFFANIYLNELDHFVKHGLRVKGYVRYVDDFVLFSDDRTVLKRQGCQMREKLAGLRLEIHPDKYRLLPTALGVDFVGFVLFADGRRKVRKSNVRRFQRRMKRRWWEVREGRKTVADVGLSVRAWIAHVQHAQSYGLRRTVLSQR